MAGFGIQKRGTSPLIVKRKKFAEGSDPGSDYVGTFETEDGIKGTYGRRAPKELIESLPDKRINLKPDKNAKPTKVPLLPSDFDIKEVDKSLEEYKKKEKEEPEKLQFRCAGPNPSKKCGHRDEKKKGGMVKDNKKIQPKKGILIIVGTKDKESKKMKKGGLAKQAAIAIAMKKAGKKPKGMKK